MSTFNDRLKGLMVEEEIKVEEIAKVAGISPSMVYRWFRQPVSVKLSHLVKLANYFSCTLDYLTGRSEDARPVTPIDVKSLGDSVKQAIRKNSKTLYRIKKDGVSNDDCLRRWCRGSDAQIYKLIAIADYLDCSLDYLVGREN